ncbi:uncharacterized protein LOC131666360 isoform X2 [Phymastichus coffea]|nr:uncharacterized protein LOC131666360 isoform X2 [Phymastichus coffea]XP_058794957.1 uncharacterized protein LOC131666360 isoform X2 [Phymastichus coffea]XP_058794958.1 uncharacterized protein LOC131666360 isoform X2 [Phymastichus coffea]XP_058794959.1 uncharacterized protein LOC131666360 isoform X2 [Phymastichus coffea]
METNETNSNSEADVNSDEPNQLAEDSVVEPFIRGGITNDDKLTIPTCSNDVGNLKQNRREDVLSRTRKNISVKTCIDSCSLKNKITGCKVPKPGTIVSPKIVRKAGPYILGPIIGSSPVRSIVQCLARKEGTDKYYTIKILTLKDCMEYENQDDRQGKMLLHSEYSLLSLLHNQDGVVHHHGFFKDFALEEKITNSGAVYTGWIKQRLCLVLDCLICHDFNPNSETSINLQHHVIKEKKLTEKESLLIFFDTVRIVACLHEKNIVHRDLKLGNLVLNKRTRKVTITNFCLGKHLSSENDLLKDQRGSPAYISPDVLCGKPYLGKPSDMWALGVVLYTMLYGQFPFYDSSPTQLFTKIKAANYYIPMDGRVSEGTISLIRNLLVLQPLKRLTAVQVLDSLTTIIAMFKVPRTIGDDEEEQVVPDISMEISGEISEKKSEKKEDSLSSRKILTDFSKQITLQEQMHQMMKQQPSPFVIRPKPYTQIPVYRVNSDARELTPTELDKYRHLIPRENQRPLPYSRNNGNDGLLLRVRGCLRNRNNSVNQSSIQNRDHHLNFRPNHPTGPSGSGVNNLNEGIFLSQPQDLNASTLSRQLINSSRQGNEANLSQNDVALTPDFSRSGRSVPNLGSNFSQWINAVVAARENHSGSNSNEAYPNSEDQLSNSPSYNHLNVPLHFSQRPQGSHVAGPSVESNRPLFSHSHDQRFRNWISPSYRRQQSRSRDSVDRNSVPRRLSIHNRNVPYLANFRHLDRTFTDLNVAQTSVRRTNSDSNLGRSFEVVMNNTEENTNGEHTLANFIRHVSQESHEAFLRHGLNSRNVSPSSNGAPSNLSSLRRDIALRLLSTVTNRTHEQSPNSNDNSNEEGV